MEGLWLALYTGRFQETGIMSATPIRLTDCMRLSVIVITRNEQANIADCLKGLSFADEIIVLDNASSDATADIARYSLQQSMWSRIGPALGLKKIGRWLWQRGNGSCP